MKLQSLFVRSALAAFTAASLAFAVTGSAAAAPALGKGGLPKTAAAQTSTLAAISEPIEAPAQDGLAAFTASVVNGSARTLRGVYVPGVLALRVVQQPAGAFSVDMNPGVATQFGGASAYGVTGLLADNVASGVDYYSLAAGQEVTLVYGDGTLRRYVVSGIARFQALNPTSPYSDFLNLDSGATLTSSDLFNQMYTGGDKVTFQTCLAQDGIMSWGRLFVTAYPMP